MFPYFILLTSFLLLSTLSYVDESYADEKTVYGHRDANGRMVFSDQESAGQPVQISKPSVVQDSKLGVKAYSRQTPNTYDKSRAADEAAARARDKRMAEVQENDDWRRSHCESLREVIAHSQYGSRTYRLGKQDEYDRDCIKNGY
ncbi:MAG: hypothetical protein ACRERR_06695 [Moraxellaceae bacterium]